MVGGGRYRDVMMADGRVGAGNDRDRSEVKLYDKAAI